METMASIAAEIARKHGITVADLKNDSQARRYAWPRQEAAYEMRERLGRGWSQIGRFLNRDHSTICTAYKKYAQRAGLDAKGGPKSCMYWSKEELARLASFTSKPKPDELATFKGRTPTSVISQWWRIKKAERVMEAVRWAAE